MDQFRFSNIIRALGQPLIFVPLLSMSTEGIPRSEAGSASALFNMSRNIGGSIGIAMLSTIVTQREHLHSVHLGEFVTTYTPAVQARLDFLRQLFESKGIDAGTANGYALAALNRSVQSNAYIMAYSDAFLVIGASLILAIGGLFFMPKSISSGRCDGALEQFKEWCARGTSLGSRRTPCDGTRYPSRCA